MAKYKAGPFGPLSGKIGSVIASSWRGVAYVKAMQESTLKPASTKQALQRAVLGLVNTWLKPLKELIWLGYQGFSGVKTPMNGAVSTIMKEAIEIVEGVPQVVYSQVLLSRGELLISWLGDVVSMPGGLMHISWQNLPETALNRGGDSAVFVIYNPEKELFVLFMGVAQRRDRQAVLKLPLGFTGDRVHGYLFYVAESGAGVSTSQYFGPHSVF